MPLSKALYHTCFICGQRCKCWSRWPKLTLSVISDVTPIIYIFYILNIRLLDFLIGWRSREIASKEKTHEICQWRKNFPTAVSHHLLAWHFIASWCTTLSSWWPSCYKVFICTSCRKGDRIYHQLRKMGGSYDWDRACFTMDPVSRHSILWSPCYVTPWSSNLCLVWDC